MSGPPPATRGRPHTSSGDVPARTPFSALRLAYLCLKVDIPNRLRFGRFAPKAGQRIYVDPCAVQNWNLLFGRSDTGKVIDGDWDKAVVPVTEIPKVNIVHRRIREGVSWQDAGAYDNLLRRIKDLGPRDGCSDLDEVKARYDRLDALIEHLATGGRFRTSSEMGGWREFGGVYVHIARNGEPLFGGGGCHRLAIAQALELKCIPAQLGVVHRQAVTNGTFRSLLETGPAR